MMKSIRILAFVEYDAQCKLKKRSKEILTQAYHIKKHHFDEALAICVSDFFDKEASSNFMDAYIREASLYGVDKLLIVEGLESSCYAYEYVTDQVEKAICTYKPQVVLFSEGSLEKAVSARLSARFDMGLIFNCIELY